MIGCDPIIDPSRQEFLPRPGLQDFIGHNKGPPFHKPLIHYCNIVPRGISGFPINRDPMLVGVRQKFQSGDQLYPRLRCVNVRLH